MVQLLLFISGQGLERALGKELVQLIHFSVNRTHPLLEICVLDPQPAGHIRHLPNVSDHLPEISGGKPPALLETVLQELENLAEPT
jgi:hypothetical protein